MILALYTNVKQRVTQCRLQAELWLPQILKAVPKPGLKYSLNIHIYLFIYISPTQTDGEAEGISGDK